MVPYSVLARKEMSALDKNGITTLYCMSTRDYLKFYNDEKYWNHDVKEEFLNSTNNLWKDLSDKYQGHTLQLSAYCNKETAIAQLKVDKELADAVAKHGEIELPERYEDQDKDEIHKRRHNIAGQ